MPTTTHAPSGKLYTPHFCITFNAKDYPLAVALQLILGGYLRDKKENNAYVLTITSHGDLQRVASLMNGFLRTPKISQFNRLLS